MAGAYSFGDVHCVIDGPGGSIILSEGGVAEEGIDVAFDDDKVTTVGSADGDIMHSLRTSKKATITVRLQKTNPKNALLQQMYDLQQNQGTAALVGRNKISVTNPVIGDSASATAVAFRKFPDFKNATEAGNVEWIFTGKADVKLGSGAWY